MDTSNLPVDLKGSCKGCRVMFPVKEVFCLPLSWIFLALEAAVSGAVLFESRLSARPSG